MPQTTALFRTDGTPCYVSYNVAKSYRPANISITIVRDGKKVFQKTVSAGSGNDVVEAWQRAADVWLGALGMTRRSAAGKAAHARFIAALEAFLDRYGIGTVTRRVFA
jgi:hypothetical protein